MSSCICWQSRRENGCPANHPATVPPAIQVVLYSLYEEKEIPAYCNFESWTTWVRFRDIYETSPEHPFFSIPSSLEDTSRQKTPRRSSTFAPRPSLSIPPQTQINQRPSRVTRASIFSPHASSSLNLVPCGNGVGAAFSSTCPGIVGIYRQSDVRVSSVRR